MTKGSKQYISTFTPLNEPERGKECPSCNRFLEINRFRSKKGVRNGIQGTIRNNRCRDCESGNHIQERIDSKEEIKILRENISVLEEKIEEYDSDLQVAMTSIVRTFDLLLEPYGLNIEKIEKDRKLGKEITLKTIYNRDNDTEGKRKPLSILSGR